MLKYLQISRHQCFRGEKGGEKIKRKKEEEEKKEKGRKKEMKEGRLSKKASRSKGVGDIVQWHYVCLLA